MNLTSEFTFEKEDDLDLQEVIIKTLQNDPNIFALRESLKLKEFTFEEVRKIYTPNVYTYREIKQEVEKAHLELKEAQKALVKSIQDEYLKLQSAKEQYNALKNSVETAKEAHRIMKIRYDVGMATPLEVMQSAERVSQAEMGLVNALFNYNQIKAKFENCIFFSPTVAGGMGV